MQGMDDVVRHFRIVFDKQYFQADRPR